MENLINFLKNKKEDIKALLLLEHELATSIEKLDFYDKTPEYKIIDKHVDDLIQKFNDTIVKINTDFDSY